MPFLTAPGNKVSVTELQMYQKMSSLEGQLQSQEDLRIPLEKRKLSTVYGRRLKESDPPHTLGRTSKAK